MNLNINTYWEGTGLVKKIFFNKVFNKQYPLTVTYICTYRCNFRCKYCNVFNCDEKEMTTEEAKCMMDQFKEMGTKRFSFNGGEPLLREDIEELIKYAKSKNFFTTMFSNGVLVKQNINKIKDLDVLLISFDGPAEIHDKQRAEGTYEKVIEAIKIAKNNGLQVWTNTVITKDNLNQIDFIIQKAKELGVLTIFQPVFEYAHASKKEKISEMMPILNGYEQAIDKLIKYKKQGYPIFHSVKYLKYIKKPNWQINKRKCFAGKLYCAITPGGNVAPCYPIFNCKEWPNGLKLGFKKALESSPKFDCNGCYCLSVENDFLFSLKPGVVYNALNYTKRSGVKI